MMLAGFPMLLLIAGGCDNVPPGGRPAGPGGAGGTSSSAPNGGAGGSGETGTIAASEGALVIDATKNVGSFIPSQVFGVNLVPNTATADYLGVRSKLEKAGVRFLRFPSGSADIFHWNGNGTLDPSGSWLPDSQVYGRSFNGGQVHRGSTSSYWPLDYSMLTDGDTSTLWVSNPDTDYPHAQWAYVDLGASSSADSITVVWGTPASRFSVQYWSPTSSNQWAPWQNGTDEWRNTTAVHEAGVAGTQDVPFTRITTRFLRLLLEESASTTGEYSVAEISAANSGTKLTSNTKGAAASVAVVSSVDTACGVLGNGGWDAPIDFEEFMAYAATLGPGVSPLIGVNFGVGTAEEAARWVHYANVVKGYGIKFWEIGNEINGPWENGGPLTARDYARRYIAFYEAMKAADPTILIGGPGVSDAFAPSNDYDGKTYIQGFIDRLANDASGNRAGTAEFIDFHWYPYCGHSTDDQFATCMLANPARFATLAAPDQLSSWLSKHPAPATVPLVLSEWNSGGDARVFSVNRGNGLWVAKTLGEYLLHFGARAYASYWTVLMAGATPDGTDQGLFASTKGTYANSEHANYWATLLLGATWAMPGSTTSHVLVNTSSAVTSIVAYATLRPDGKLAVAVLNVDASRAHTLQLTLNGFSPAPKVNVNRLDATTYDWQADDAGTSHASPNTPPTATTVSVVDALTPTFPPYSITVLAFDPVP